MSVATELPRLVPNDDWRPRERFDIRPHGTEARAPPSPPPRREALPGLPGR
jgi:hypothetical protein